MLDNGGQNTSMGRPVLLYLLATIMLMVALYLFASFGDRHPAVPNTNEHLKAERAKRANILEVERRYRAGDAAAPPPLPVPAELATFDTWSLFADD